jgi:hypothetical protein
MIAPGLPALREQFHEKRLQCREVDITFAWRTYSQVYLFLREYLSSFGYGEIEGRSLTWFTFDPDFTPVGFYQMPGNGG